MPSGSPDSTKPMKSGTAEQEQNGVITPMPAASRLPTPSRLPPNQRRVCSGVMNVRSSVIRKIITESSSRILGTS